MSIREGLSESQAGKLGGLATKEIHKKRKLQAIKIYSDSPNYCLYCGGVIPYEKRFNKCCCQSHATSYSNLNRPIEVYDKQKKTLKQNLSQKARAKHCKYCGSIKGQCKDTFVCKKHQLYKTLVKFGFDLNTVGHDSIIDEFYRIRNILQDFYLKYGADEQLLMEKFEYNSGAANFHKILKALDIKSRNFAEAQQFAIESGRRDLIPAGIHYQFKDGYHTTWDGREVYLRSSYESAYAKMLDAKKVYYEVESLKIKYFDTLQNRHRLAIPDFFIDDYNLIVEIKSDFTLDVQNMKDKAKAYKEQGYNFKLILNHKEIDINML